MRLADRLREEFAALAHRGADLSSFHATFSAGVALLGPDADLDHWRKAADQALYAAKRMGRNRVVGATLNPVVPLRRSLRRPVAARHALRTS